MRQSRTRLNIHFEIRRGLVFSWEQMRRFFSTSLSKITDPTALAKHLEGKVMIDGQFRTVSARFDVNSPATGKLVATAARGTEKVGQLEDKKKK